MYISENISAAEVLRIHGDDLPEAFHPVFERLIGASESELRADNAEFCINRAMDLITEANWRTGKKAELKELIESLIDALTDAD